MDGTKLRIVKGLKVKKLLTALTLAALALPAMPVAAATTFGSPTVDVNWNVTASGSVTLYSDYANGGSACGSESTGCGTPAVLQSPAAGAGTCTAAPAAPTANTGAAGSTTGVFFGNIAPDLTTKNTECYYKNAVDAVISTNDANYSLTEDVSVASTNAAGYWLCEVNNGTVPTASVTPSAAASAPTGFTAAGAVAACPTGMTRISTTAGGTTAYSQASGSTPSNAHVGQDYALVVPALAGTGAAQFVVTYTFVGN